MWTLVSFFGGFLLAELVRQGMEQLHIVLVDKITTVRQPAEDGNPVQGIPLPLASLLLPDL